MSKKKSSKSILEKAIDINSILKAMEAYAEQEAIDFHVWLNTQTRDNKIGNRGLMKLWYDYKVQRKFSE